ncbi:MAG TPA: hypothetical protein VGC08_07680 [Pedobacter sp.]
MSKKKKSGFSGHENKVQDKQRRNLFNQKIEQVCNAIAGPGYFKKLRPEALNSMYACRYPVLKAKAEPGTDIPKSKVIQYNKLMNKFIGDIPVDLENGNSIPLGLYLSEGLLLINCMAELAENHTGDMDHFIAPFRDYFQGTESDEVIIEMLNVLVSDTNIFLSDLNHSIIYADITRTACFDKETTFNDIFIREFRPERSSIIIDGEKRSLIRVGWIGWADEKMEWSWAKVKPSAIGFKTGSLDIPLDVYIQQHALNSLQERIDITPGILHYLVFAIFMQEDIPHHKYNSHTLVECKLSDQKAGYFLVTLNDAKLIIRTFLFLTNDGTPEGEKLRKLLEINKEDKQYLMIDKLPTFNSYHIEKNERLSKLFTDAGCGSLLKLGHLKEYSQKDIRDKDPESILKYLSDAEYFKGLSEG